MALPSSAVTFTLMTVSPTASATWWPVTPVSASVSVASTVQIFDRRAVSLFVGVTVTSATVLATDAV